MKFPTNKHGYALIAVMLIFTLVAASLLFSGNMISSGTQLQNQRTINTQKTLKEIKDALIGFAIANQRLPRPADLTTNGAENNCTSIDCSGFIPWTVLGINKLDDWGKLIQYSVTYSFTNAPITCTSPGTKTILPRDSSGTLGTPITQVPVVFLSFGAKNFGTSDAGISIINGSSTNLDEQTNSALGTVFVTRSATDSTSVPGGEFDDTVTWISTDTLICNLAKAHALPVGCACPAGCACPVGS